jgi:alpha-1,6-mannosyltransferase
MWAGFVAYVGVLALSPLMGRRAVWALIVVTVLAFTVMPPLLSHDVYSYVDYARLGVLHGLNPYVHSPIAAPGDPVFANVDWRHTASVYGPLFTLATYPLAWLGVGLAVAVLKVAAALAVFGMALTMERVAPARGVDPRRAAAFVALNPLVLVHVIGGAHNDGIAMLAATLGVAALLAEREVAGGAAFVVALAIKPPAALAAPFALLSGRRSAGLRPDDRSGTYIRRHRSAPRLLLGGALALCVIGFAAYLAFGWHWLGAMSFAGRSQSWTSHLSIPTTTARITGLDASSVRAAALGLLSALVAYLLIWTWRGGDWVRAAAWASFGLLLATSWLLPWYLIWSLPLAALSRDRALQLLLLALTAYQLAARIPL